MDAIIIQTHALPAESKQNFGQIPKNDHEMFTKLCVI